MGPEILEFHLILSLESHGILKFHFPGLESHGVLTFHFPGLESHGILECHFSGLESQAILIRVMKSHGKWVM